MAKSKGQISITIEKTSTGFSAYSKDAKGIYTTGTSIDELKENIREVIEEQVDYLQEIGDTVNAENLRSANIEYKIDLEQFFEYFSMFNKTEFAKYIGLNPSLLRGYSKGGVYISDDRVRKIEEGIHRLGKELTSVSFA